MATLLEQVDAGVRNTAVLIDRTGEIRLVYAKVHTCAFDVEKVLEPGDAFPVAELDTGAGPVKVGDHDLLRPRVPRVSSASSCSAVPR